MLTTPELVVGLLTKTLISDPVFVVEETERTCSKQVLAPV